MKKQVGQGRRTQEALRQSEERFRLLVAHALAAVITIDIQGRITSWTPQAERLFGWAQAEVLGRLLSETIIPPTYREAHERGLARFRATGEGPVLGRRIELTALHRNGTEFPVELAITPMRSGKTVLFSAFLRDITEAKRAEEARRQSEASFRLLFTSNPLPMWVYDVATMAFLEVNAAAVAHYGYSREEFLAMRITDIRPPEEVPRLEAILTGFGAEADPAVRRHAGTWTHRLKDGRIREVDIVSHAIDFAGRRAALVVAIDVTELRQTQASLAKSTERLRILHEIDRALIAAEALLASGVHTYMVVPMIAGGELIGGLSFGGAPGEFSPEQIGIAQEVAAQLAIALAQARLHERVKRQAEELEQRVQERTRELSTANEQLQREVAERQRAEADADRANRAKSEFLSRMSHELRTPLNAILGFAQLLELEVERPADRESVEQIAKGGRHLLTLINEILDIARIEAGQLPLSPEPVRVGDAIQRVLDLTRPLAATRRIELETGGAALHPEHVWADQQRLQQVLLNLVSNGIKYNRDAGRLTVTCDAAEADRIRISVQDTGPGIAPALRERLFQPFDRLGAEQHGVEGTGLGLALSKRLVEAMGGTIGVESVPSAGSTFWVEFLRAESPIDRLARTEPSPAVLAAPAERDGTVLYIEDNLSNLRLVERTLALRPGVKLIPAMQGRLGLALAQQHRPDLILLDLHLPDISGEQVLRELQGDPGLRQTPVVVLSADATPGQVQRLLAAGVRAYLTKPLDVRQLLALLDEVLRTGGGA